MLRGLTGRPTYGVLPFAHGLGIDEEDGLRVSLRGAVRESVVAPPVGEDVLRVAVCAVPLMSNFTDVDALAAEPGVVVRFVDRPEELADADLVVVPGTRGTVRAWRGCGSAGWPTRWRGGPPRGGRCSASAAASSCSASTSRTRSSRGPGRVEGLGLLPVRVRFAPREDPGPAGRRGARRAVEGYEIHHGVAEVTAARRSSPTTDSLDGCRVGAVWGTHWHGSLESDGFRRAFLRDVAAAGGPAVRARARHRLRGAARGAAGPARRPDRGARGHGCAAAADRVGRARQDSLHRTWSAMAP